MGFLYGQQRVANGTTVLSLISFGYCWIIDHSISLSTVVWKTGNWSFIVSLLDVHESLIRAQVWSLLYEDKQLLMLQPLPYYFSFQYDWIIDHSTGVGLLYGQQRVANGTTVLSLISFGYCWIIDHSISLSTVVWKTGNWSFIVSLLDVHESLITAQMWSLLYEDKQLLMLQLLPYYFSFQYDWIIDHSTGVGFLYGQQRVANAAAVLSLISFGYCWIIDHSISLSTVVWKTGNWSFIVSFLDVHESLITA